jgi:hypothetical protein
MIALSKKNQANKCSDHKTGKTVACAFSRKFESKVEEVVGK